MKRRIDTHAHNDGDDHETKDLLVFVHYLFQKPEE